MHCPGAENAAQFSGHRSVGGQAFSISRRKRRPIFGEGDFRRGIRLGWKTWRASLGRRRGFKSPKIDGAVIRSCRPLLFDCSGEQSPKIDGAVIRSFRPLLFDGCGDLLVGDQFFSGSHRKLRPIFGGRGFRIGKTLVCINRCASDSNSFRLLNSKSQSYR